MSRLKTSFELVLKFATMIYAMNVLQPQQLLVRGEGWCYYGHVPPSMFLLKNVVLL
jgi:hypothetical protein